MAAGSMEEIAEKLKKMKFRKKAFGGVDEREVWKKMASLQEDYRNAFLIQHQKDKALLEDREETIRSLRKELEACKNV